MVGIADIITHTIFGDDRLRGLGVAEGQICPSPLTLIVALTHSCTTVRVRDIYLSILFMFLLTCTGRAVDCMNIVNGSSYVFPCKVGPFLG